MKNNLLLMFFLGVIFITPSSVFGQSKNYSEKEKEELIALHNSIKGTYQIQMIDVRYPYSMHIDVAKEIEKRRLEDQDTYFQYNQDIRILILSKDRISNPKFKAIDRVVYLNSSDL